MNAQKHRDHIYARIGNLEAEVEALKGPCGLASDEAVTEAIGRLETKEKAEMRDLKDELARVTAELGDEKARTEHWTAKFWTAKAERDEAQTRYFALEAKLLPRSPLTPEGEEPKGEFVAPAMCGVANENYEGSGTWLQRHAAARILSKEAPLTRKEVEAVHGYCTYVLARYGMEAPSSPEDPRLALFGEMLGYLKDSQELITSAYRREFVRKTSYESATQRLADLIQRAEQAMEGSSDE